jgi:hypothetical protein
MDWFLLFMICTGLGWDPWTTTVDPETGVFTPHPAPTRTNHGF